SQSVNSPATLGYRLLWLASDNPSSRAADLWFGIDQPNDSPARRAATQGGPENIESIGRTAVKRRNLQAILEQTMRANHAKLSSQIGEMISGLDANSACELLDQLGQRLHREGQWDLAAKTFEMLANRYPEHPAAGSALVWMVQYQASGEALLR